jgi:N-acetylmuramoyl-L-alanine amidase
MLPVVETRRDFFGVLTPCEVRGWVRADEVEALSRANTADNLDNATVVIDAGHGGSLPGSVGPTGLREAEPNLAIARALAGHLGRARVFLTRDGDYTAGLAYRNAIANSLGAHALVSLHNNADPDGPFEKPGSETYYQYRSTASKRLSGLVYEELVRALARFPVAWVADRDAGAKYRLNSGGADYYALLRGSRVPAVIVESLFVSNRPEEELLRRPDVLDAIAGAVAAALKRFFETEDPGSGFVVPYPREPGPSGRLPATCNDPGP